MSRCVWAKAMCPDLSAAPSSFKDENFSELEEVANCLPLMATDRDITIPQPRAFRSMSRASLFLSSVCMEVEELLKESLEADPFSVGIYCALENGPIHIPTTRELSEVDNEDFAVKYKKLRNPKMYLKQLPNLAPAQLGISLNVQGPLNVFTHSRAASLQAADLAEFDLKEGRVKLALVCATFSFEDPLMVARARKDHQGATLCEGAGAVLLEKSESDSPFNSYQINPKFSFGIANEIVQYAKERENHVNKQ